MSDSQVLDSTAVELTNEKFQSFLLPQAFPEGSPLLRAGWKALLGGG